MNTSNAPHVCVLTPSGRGAVAVVAVEGEGAVTITDRFFQAANQRPLSEQPVGHIVYGHWGDIAGEDLVVCRRSKTSLEIHCHGGRQSSTQIVVDLSAVGGTVIDSNAWLDGCDTHSITAAAQLALTQATTFRTATILLDQYHGALQRELEALLAELSSENLAAATTRIESLLQYAELGKHLTEPWRVVIAGRPNVGKSSLINALIGYERAIVFDQPGTTRDVVSSTTAIEGWPVEFSDTAGLHDATDVIETAGISLARQRLVAADLVVWVLDATEVSAGDKLSLWELAKVQAETVSVQLEAKKTLLVINKIDLAEELSITPSHNVGTCAVTGAGIQELLTNIITQLIPTAPSTTAAIPFAVEQFTALQVAHAALDQNDLHAAVFQVQSLLRFSLSKN